MSNIFPEVGEGYTDGYEEGMRKEPQRKTDLEPAIFHINENTRIFESGASRDQDKDKPDIEGFCSPLVWKEFAEYMHKHRVQSDGTIRESDNWQKGIPLDAYMKSLLRHVMDVWLEHRGEIGREGLRNALCGVLFNTQGYLFEILREDI